MIRHVPVLIGSSRGLKCVFQGSQLVQFPHSSATLIFSSTKLRPSRNKAQRARGLINMLRKLGEQLRRTTPASTCLVTSWWLVDLTLYPAWCEIRTSNLEGSWDLGVGLHACCTGSVSSRSPDSWISFWWFQPIPGVLVNSGFYSKYSWTMLNIDLIETTNQLFWCSKHFFCLLKHRAARYGSVTNFSKRQWDCTAQAEINGNM